MMRDQETADRAVRLVAKLRTKLGAIATTATAKTMLRVTRAISRSERILKSVSEQVPDGRPALILERRVRPASSADGREYLEYARTREVVAEDFIVGPWEVHHERCEGYLYLRREVCLKPELVKEIVERGGYRDFGGPSKSLAQAYDTRDDDRFYTTVRPEFTGVYVQVRGKYVFHEKRYKTEATQAKAKEYATKALWTLADPEAIVALDHLITRINRRAQDVLKQLNKEFTGRVVAVTTQTTDSYKNEGDNGLDTLLTAHPAGKTTYAKLLKARAEVISLEKDVKAILLAGMIADWEDTTENKWCPEDVRKAVLDKLKNHPSSCLNGSEHSFGSGPTF